MALLRIDVERALDELVANEEGLRFQGLALVLGKMRWPELIAHQRKKDLGLDAYAPSSLTAERFGRGLAASITSTLRKISKIAATAKRNFPDLRDLLFVTSAKVGNSDRRRWRQAIRKAHAVELHVMEREEIITQMLIPGNASLWGTFLRQTSSYYGEVPHAAPLIVDGVFSSVVLSGNEFLDRLTDIALRARGLDKSAVRRRHLLVDTEEGYDRGDLHLDFDPSVSFVELLNGSRLTFRNDHVCQLARELIPGSAIGSEPLKAKIGMKRGCTYEGCKPLPIGKFTVEIIYLRDFKSLHDDEKIEYLMQLLFEARCESSYIWGGNMTSLYHGSVGADLIRSLDVGRAFPTIVTKIADTRSQREDGEGHVTLNAFYWHMVEEYKGAFSDSWDAFMNALWIQLHHLAMAANEQLNHYFAGRHR